MPIVDIATPPIDAAIDTPKGFAVTPGEAETQGSERPAWSSAFGAAFRQDNIVGSYLTGKTEDDPYRKEEGFDAWQNIKGTSYEPHWESFVDVHNSTAFDQRKQRIDRQLEDRKLLDSAPWWMSFPAQMTAGVVDLPTLLPGGAFVRGVKGGFSVAKSALSVGAASGIATGIQEAGLQATQDIRPFSESAVNIGASTLLGGLLGAGGARLLSNVEWNRAVRLIERDLESGVREIEGGMLGSPASAGAAANVPTDIAGNTIAGKAAGAVAAATERLNPLLRVLQSPSAAARDIGTQLFENPLYLQKHFGGGAVGAPAAETLMKEWNAGLGKALSDTDKAFAEYRKAGGQLTRTEFREAVGKAMRRGDEDADPHVTKVAQNWRKEVFDPLKEAAIKAGLLDPDVSVETAASYFSRMWSVNKLNAQEGRFKQIVTDFYRQDLAQRFESERIATANKLIEIDTELERLSSVPPQPESAPQLPSADEVASRLGIDPNIARTVSVAISEQIGQGHPSPAEIIAKLTSERDKLAREFDARWSDLMLGKNAEMTAKGEPDFGEHARSIADAVFERLTGRTEAGVRPEFMPIGVAGPLKERTFNIPDALVEDFLEHDIDLVGRRYTRVMGADVELQNRFGSVDLKREIEAIRRDYEQLRSQTSDETALGKLAKDERKDIRDIEAVRDLLRGTRQESPLERDFARITGIAGQINYLRLMGEAALASVAESVRPAMVHGLMQFMTTIPKLIANLEGVRMSVREAKLAGSVMERVLTHRLASIAEITDPHATRGPIEGFIDNMTRVASRWNGLTMLTDMQKSVASVMTQDRILKGVGKYGDLADRERAYMRYLNIDQSMAERIATQFEQFGDVVDGVRVAGTENWTDDIARRTYRAAINKDVDSIITTPGVADIPLFAHTPTGKAMLQFRRFALAAHQRVLLRGLQEDQTRFLGGTIAMVAIGMMTTYLKAVSGNTDGKLADIKTNPGWWVSEGLDKSGILSIPMELANVAEKATGFHPIKSPIRAFDEGSRLSQRTQNRSLVGTFAGPTAGLFDDIGTVAFIPKRLVDGQEVSQGQKNAAERLLPFSSYAGVRQILRYVINPREDEK